MYWITSFFPSTHTSDMVNTRKSSSAAAKTDSDQRASRSGSKASANAPAIHDKGGKQTKNKAKKVEQVLIEENTSVAPPPIFLQKIPLNSATSSLSKDDLQGASCITGGFSCGRATGNIFNYGDEEDDQEPSFDLQEVLSMISLCENGNWNIKGRYMKIMEKEIQSAKWQMDDKNNYFLEILADGADNNETSITKAPSGSSTDDEVQLIKSKGKEDIHTVYEKYEMIDDIWKNKKSSLSIIQASAKADVDKKVLINVFMSPSTYYTYPYKVFPLLKYHSKMLSWMKNEGGIDKKSVWGSQKPGFSSLYDILKGKEAAAEEHKEEQSKGKGKGERGRKEKRVTVTMIMRR
ncbi:hypothetical protein BDQ17DRAFT_1329434 [Cyathus striatus]|nr:hypothetical protein BDQ17DRAFT_1329434 [Cyathus striatus]